MKPQPGLFDDQIQRARELGCPWFTDQAILDNLHRLPGYAVNLIQAQPADATITVEWLYQQALLYQRQERAYSGELALFSRDRADALLCAYDLLKPAEAASTPVLESPQTAQDGQGRAQPPEPV